MHPGVWDKSATGSHEMRGRTLGIVGYGNIGSQLSVLAEALGMSVLFYDTADKLAMGNARRCASLDELLDAADVVTLHVDGRPGNSGFFGPARVRADAAGQRSSSTCPGASWSTTRALARPDQVRPSRRSRRRRLPRGAGSPRRGVRLRAAGAGKRHPHAARRRLDGGGAAGHRALRRRQAARLPGRRRAPPCRSTSRRSRCRRPATPAAAATCTATPPACSPPSTGCSPTTRSTSSPSCSPRPATTATSSPTSRSAQRRRVRAAAGAAGDGAAAAGLTWRV